MIAAALVALLLAQPSSPDAVSLTVPTRHSVEQDGTPQISVRINQLLEGYTLTLTRTDGKTFRFEGRGRRNSTQRFAIPQPNGKQTYEGKLEIRFADAGVLTQTLAFDVEVLEPVRLTLDVKDVDLERRTLAFRLTRPATRAHLEVVMDTGDLAFDDEVALDARPAGSKVTLSWPKQPGRVLRIRLKAWDAADFWDSVEVTPWQLEIPHEEVNFPTASAVIPQAERSKLAGSYAELSAAVSQYGHLAKLRLFVLGHTDTVGAEHDNDLLARARARSIAAYFRKRGLKLPIHFAGLGEQAPLVATPDETDEPRNRRAQYILAIEEPNLTTTELRPKWQRL